MKKSNFRALYAQREPEATIRDCSQTPDAMPDRIHLNWESRHRGGDLFLDGTAPEKGCLQARTECFHNLRPPPERENRCPEDPGRRAKRLYENFQTRRIADGCPNLVREHYERHRGRASVDSKRTG